MATETQLKGRARFSPPTVLHPVPEPPLVTKTSQFGILLSLKVLACRLLHGNPNDIQYFIYCCPPPSNLSKGYNPVEPMYATRCIPGRVGFSVQRSSAWPLSERIRAFPITSSAWVRHLGRSFGSVSGGENPQRGLPLSPRVDILPVRCAR